jgi:uroporphyrinogen decarboxylase
MESERLERVQTVMKRGTPDRVPWAIWGHFPAIRWLNGYSWEKSTRDGEELAKAHLALLRELDYNMDLLKVTPYYRYMAQQWGSRFTFKDNEEDAVQVKVAVEKPEDWAKLKVLNPRRELREHLRAVEVLARDLRRVPFIYTIPSPLIQAMNGVGTPERVIEDAKSNPDALKQGLETITETCVELARACVAEGAAGVFLGVGGGGRVWRELTQRQLEDHGLRYDARILKAVDAPVKLLHACSTPLGNPGEYMRKGWFRKYPATAFNWDTDHTSLAEGKKTYGGDFCIVGGVDHKTTLRTGTPTQVEAAVKEAIAEGAAGGGFMVGAGCTVFQDTPWANLNAIGRAVGKHGAYRK